MNKVDFLPEHIKEARRQRMRMMVNANVLIVLAAVLAGIGFLREDSVKEAQAGLEHVEQRRGQVTQQLELRKELERQQGDLRVKKRIDDELGSRASALVIMGELDRLLPKSMALKDLRIEATDVRVPVKKAGLQTNGPVVAGGSAQASTRVVKRVRLVITGLAPNDVDVANFIGQLSACPLFEDVNMGYSKTIEFRQRQAREFQASCYVIR
ncbi:MAG: PilN domain-containing protein [Phycisphaerae bacterium]